ncbi:MAG: hypothetical protein HQK86_07590 [Nitrospinae bacterium]|nr:hypothetical protein [Nitrospinota bacterium]
MSEVKPQMAYPSFASATATFSPSVWPLRDGGYTRSGFTAMARTAGGGLVAQSSPLTEERITLSYRGLSRAEAESFAGPGGTGFFHTVGAKAFEYKDYDGSIRTVRLASRSAEIAMQGQGRFSIGPVEMVVA